MFPVRCNTSFLLLLGLSLPKEDLSGILWQEQQTEEISYEVQCQVKPIWQKLQCRYDFFLELCLQS